MKTKFLTGLALAACLLIGGPAFGHDNRGGGKGGHRVAAVHRGGGGGHREVAEVRRSSGRGRMAGVSRHESRGGNVASGRSFTSGNREVASRSRHSRPSVAFGGGANNFSSYAKGRGNGRYTYAFSSHNGWRHDREYNWNGHQYRWFDNAWYVVGPYPYGYANYTPGYGGDPVTEQVQAELSRDGYYQGPVDGIQGPGTQAAIAAFQRDNGLRVTGAINRRLLSYLGVG